MVLRFGRRRKGDSTDGEHDIVLGLMDLKPTPSGPHDPALPAVPRRHPFTSTFLALFLLDGATGLLAGVGYLLGRRLFDPDRFSDVLIPFGFALLMGALVQVSLSFSRGMRWSARIIGLCVVAYWMVQMMILLVVAVFWTITRGLEAPPPEGTALSDPALGTLLLIVNTLQLALGIWATRDLSRGHYL
jgi:hypothetical protein